MRVCLDDDLDSNALIGLREKSGREVNFPRAVEPAGLLMTSICALRLAMGWFG